MVLHEHINSLCRENGAEMVCPMKEERCLVAFLEVLENPSFQFGFARNANASQETFGHLDKEGFNQIEP